MNEINAERLRKILYLTAAAFFLTAPLISPALGTHAPGLAVIAGIIFAVSLGNPFASFSSKLVSPMLGAAIVGMGFGMNLTSVLKVGADGILYTFLGIAAGIGLGVWLGRMLGLNRDAIYLVSIGTSICGGSAIAAAAPVLKAKAHDIAIASATVFTLNAAALLIFPVIGHMLSMNEHQFGLWSALAIHDTSSVVGATFQYGPAALETGTTVKLARALWIVPVTMLLSYFIAERGKDEKRSIRFKIPWFIPGFLAASAFVSWVPGTAEAGMQIKSIAQCLMLMTLFFIGSNLSREKLKELGFKAVLHGLLIWLILASVWCAAIHYGLVRPAL